MNMRKLLLCVCVVSLCLFSAFSSISYDLTASAYTLPTGTVEISGASMLAYLGNTISGQYLKSDMTYGDCDYSYVGSYIVQDGEGVDGSLIGRTVLLYQSGLYSSLTDLNTTWALAYGGIFDAYANFTDVTYFDGGYLWDVGISSSATIFDFTPSTLRQVCYFDYNSGSSYDIGYIKSYTNLSGVDQAAYCYTSYNSSRYFASAHVILDSSDIGNSGIVNIGSLNYACERGGSVATNRLQVAVVCPIINSDYTWAGANPPNPPSAYGSGSASGSISGTVGSDTVNVNVDLDLEVEQPDLSEEGPLSWIGDKITAIIDGIKGLFVPSEEAVTDFKEDVTEDFIEHLGGIPDGISLIDEQLDYFEDAVAVESIYVARIDVPIQYDSGGNVLQTFSIGGWDVDLKPESVKLHVLYDALAFMIDICALFMVLNMCKTKLEIMLNPEGECISYGD